MNNYIKHLHELSNQKTFGRKKDYINYNVQTYLKEVGFNQIRALELGPGLGEFESYLNDNQISNIDIVDNDKSILKYVSNRYKINKAFLVNNLALISTDLDKYNFIYLMQVLEHFPISHYSSVLKRLYQHLEKGGYLIVIVPNGNNPLGLVERYADLQHTSCFTEQSLKDLINLSGIKNYQIEIKGFEIPPYGVINLIRIVCQKILHIILLFLMIINGGIYFKTMTPNIMLVIRKA